MLELRNVSIVDTEHKFAAEFFGQQPVKNSRTGIADVHIAGRARRKSNFYIRHLNKKSTLMSKLTWII